MPGTISIPIPSSFKRDVIVVVEDSKPAAITLCGLLGKLNFDVIEFGDGHDAWEWFQKLPINECKRIKAIFSDVSMPKMDGVVLLRKVRTRVEFHGTKFVFCSAIIDPKIVREAISLRSNGYIVKPVMPSVLKKKIDEIFSPQTPATAIKKSS